MDISPTYSTPHLCPPSFPWQCNCYLNNIYSGELGKMKLCAFSVEMQSPLTNIYLVPVTHCSRNFEQMTCKEVWVCRFVGGMHQHLAQCVTPGRHSVLAYWTGKWQLHKRGFGKCQERLKGTAYRVGPGLELCVRGRIPATPERISRGSREGVSVRVFKSGAYLVNS